METQEKHRQAIENCLNRIRQHLMSDGGDCELVDVSEDGKTVYVRLKGACSHCAGAIWTLKLGIEQTLKKEVPGVESVVPVP